MHDAAEFDNVHIHHIGRENRPVLVIDDFLPDPGLVLAQARQASFQPFVRFFPGVQAPYPFDRFSASVAPYSPIIKHALNIKQSPSVIECGLAMVTTPPEQLHPLQSIPHIDTIDPNRIAVLAYVSGERFGGTAFYRHKSTGFEAVTASRRKPYNSALDADIENHGVPERAYISDDTEIFEQIATFEAKPGRAIVYFSNSLHSGHIQHAADLTRDVTHGRLTLNAFLS